MHDQFSTVTRWREIGEREKIREEINEGRENVGNGENSNSSFFPDFCDVLTMAGFEGPKLIRENDRVKSRPFLLASPHIYSLRKSLL